MAHWGYQWAVRLVVPRLDRVRSFASLEAEARCSLDRAYQRARVLLAVAPACEAMPLCICRDMDTAFLNAHIVIKYCLSVTG